MVVMTFEDFMSAADIRGASPRQAELNEWLVRATGEGVIDLASLRGSMRAPTNLLQQLAEAVLDSSVSVLPDGGLPVLRQSWARFEAETRGTRIDPDAGMTIVADPLAACAAAVLGLVSPGRQTVIVEPLPPQVVDVVRRVGGVTRTVSMRPTDWEFDVDAFAHRVGARTDLIVVADPNPLSGEHLPADARATILAAVEQYGCYVLLDETARHSVVEGETPETAEFLAALGSHCVRVDVPAAAVLAQAASAASIIGAPDVITPIRSAATAFGLGATTIAQSVLARRFQDGIAIDDAATLNGLVSSGRALLLDGLDDIGVLGLGGSGGWYVPIRAKALYDGPHNIGEILAVQSGLGSLPLAPFYLEGSSDPYILFSYLRDASVLENGLERLADFYISQNGGAVGLALPSPDGWTDLDDNASDFRGDSNPLPAPTRQKETESFESEEDYIDEDVRYRAAIAELTNVPTDGVSDEYLPEEETLQDETQGHDPVVLPFGSWGGRANSATIEDNNSQASERPDAEQEDVVSAAPEVSVFKLSVPDIVSPNIETAATPGASVDVANDEPDPGVDDVPVVQVEPLPRDPLKEDEGEPVSELGKRGDRPFFFD